MGTEFIHRSDWYISTQSAALNSLQKLLERQENEDMHSQLTLPPVNV